MSSPAPTYAKIRSLSHWATFFNQPDGLFRLPSTQGAAIQHLDIDLRFVADHQVETVDPHLETDTPIHLPNVCILTFRGGEYVQDDDLRMDALAEILLAVNPVEVRWLTATDDPSEQLSFATHLVHPAVIAAGVKWSAAGTLRKLVLQGGFPCPNLTAPTPFALTPAATPCPSPGPARTTFGFQDASSKHHPAPFVSGLSALSTIKPKTIDDDRLKAREERKRQAQYTLKPRFEYAFGKWPVQELKWRLDGRYSPACIISIVSHFVNAINSSFPSATRHSLVDLPAAVSFTSIPAAIIPDLQSLPEKLGLDEKVRDWLSDVGFGSLGGARHARLWDNPSPACGNDHRDCLRAKAELILLGDGAAIVTLEELTRDEKAHGDRSAMSPADSIASLLSGATESPTDDENEAVTPEHSSSPLVNPTDETDKKAAGDNDNVRPIETSVVL
ncbi:hypothetical protein I314_02540 [Cryptococcus bacillisporus CA1873]|uniref:Uncharacterized protein n=1 Tax=Cryptococcus bacillisporus CA1873 TaxID=1296111 RepID=A0ABR5BDR7_CRYGA|nr:hypothetical protein I314_02540 [Cryptococcus bacillisporus CA1873]|eukprot:KIR67322.1 hypothetical protein I314_02540 [Cryptococcus gattii CA1873]